MRPAWTRVGRAERLVERAGRLEPELLPHGDRIQRDLQPVVLRPASAGHRPLATGKIFTTEHAEIAKNSDVFSANSATSAVNCSSVLCGESVQAWTSNRR